MCPLYYCNLQCTYLSHNEYPLRVSLELNTALLCAATLYVPDVKITGRNFLSIRYVYFYKKYYIYQKDKNLVCMFYTAEFLQHCLHPSSYFSNVFPNSPCTGAYQMPPRKTFYSLFSVIVE